MIAAPLALGSLTSILGPTRAATATAGTATGVAGAGDAFASMLASFTQNTVTSMKGAEATSIAGLQGKATTQSVVEAVMNAQERLQTALAVRDKAVTAFQDVTRMAI